MELEEKCEQEISVHGTNKDNRWNKMVDWIGKLCSDGRISYQYREINNN
jgi:hypothetical protein